MLGATQMRKEVVRFLYDHRVLPKRLISILMPNPVLLNLRYFKIYVRLDDWAVGARIAVNRTYEQHVTRAVRSFLKPGAVVIDIGANIGYYTLLAASHVGNAGKVIAFEPSSNNCALLDMSVQKNNFNNVVIHTKAVTSENGYVAFGMDDSNGNISQNISVTHPSQVEAVALDTFLKDESRIDVIKIDIEGAEGLALNGMKRILGLHHPVIFTEFCPNALLEISGISPENYLNGLRDLGYELYIILNNDFVKQLPQSNQEIMTIYAECKSDHLDLQAIPKEVG
jgi:FkbM family methyltransferase